jgi:hypothetical protein
MQFNRETGKFGRCFHWVGGMIVSTWNMNGMLLDEDQVDKPEYHTFVSAANGQTIPYIPVRKRVVTKDLTVAMWNQIEAITWAMEQQGIGGMDT